MDPLGGIVGHVATAAMGLAAWEGIRHLAHYLGERRPLKALYAFNSDRPIWIALSEVPIAADGEFFNRASPIDGVYSTDDVTDYLRSIGFARSSYNIRFSSELSNDAYRDNLVLIGGYENNVVSATLSNQYGAERSFHWKDNVIHEDLKQSSPRSWGIELTAGKISRDYCLVTRLPNPFTQAKDHKTMLVAFEGVRHFGTIGGVQFSNSALVSSLRKLGVTVAATDRLEMVLAIDVKYPKDGYRVELNRVEAIYQNGSRRF